MAEKRVQKGRVVRLSEEAEKRVEKLKQEGESWNQAILRLVSGPVYWLVPSAKKVFETKKEARGFAVLAAVQKGEDSPEEPVKVRVE